MVYAVGVLILFVGVAVSIALHEIGHLVPAKKFGVKVTQYMVGFGPTVWSRHKGETEYGIKAIPLGGYVRMIGMLPPRRGDRPGELRSLSTGRFSQLADQARADSMEEVQPGDEDRVFYKLSPWKKLIIMSGGPLVNFALAAVMLVGVITLYGLPQVVPVVGAVSACVPTAAPTVEDPHPACQAGDPAAPSQAAGLQLRDRVVSIDGKPITTWEEMSAAIRASGGKPMAFVVMRAGEQVSLTVTPAMLARAVVDEAGNPVVKDGKVVTQKVGFVGVTPRQELVKTPLAESPAFVWDLTVRTASIVVRIPEKMVGVAQAAFGEGERDPNGPIGVFGLARIGGEIAALEIPAEEGGNWAKISPFVMLIASLNLALFVFNLIPLLPLDGGHIAGAAWEGLKKGAARVLRRPDPGYVDVAKGLPIAYGVSMVLIVMSVLLLYADIVKPVRLFG